MSLPAIFKLGLDMIEALFMFGGRLNRFQYFLAGVLTHLVGGGILLLGVVSMGNGAGAGAIATLALAGIALIWMALSLQAARIRDIGLSPLLVIMAFTIVYSMAHIGKETMKDTDVGTVLAGLTIALQAVFGFFLLLMPGEGSHTSDPPDPLDDNSALLDRRTAMIRSEDAAGMRPTPRHSEEASTRGRQAGTKPSFGRRGV
ncbi:MAG: DUF805 domain-containing protein [Allorhizobium sp.]